MQHVSDTQLCFPQVSSQCLNRFTTVFKTYQRCVCSHEVKNIDTKSQESNALYYYIIFSIKTDIMCWNVPTSKCLYFVTESTDSSHQIKNHLHLGMSCCSCSPACIHSVGTLLALPMTMKQWCCFDVYFFELFTHIIDTLFYSSLMYAHQQNGYEQEHCLRG